MSVVAHPSPVVVSRARSRRLRLALLIVLLIATPVVSIAFGAASVPMDQVLGVLADHLGLRPAITWDAITDAIVWQNRMPRILAGIGVGAVLGVSGVALQAVVRNPLAEPYVLGVSAGASTGAATAIIVVGVSSTLGVAGMAFLGALTATFMVLGVGGRRHGSALTLVLAGLAVGFIFQALTNLIIFSSDSPETARSVMFWMLGSLAKVSWGQSIWILCVAIALMTMLWLCAPWLDALASGDRTSLSVGINPAAIRLVILIPVSAAVGIIVALAGGIGFVGLIIPHLMRSFTGYGHRLLVVASGLAGAVFLVWADTFSRTVFSPSELPIGVITGLLGAPFLLALVSRMNPAR
ncbi:FecCD family ABC transporter permease [Acidipropionibacterium virtanenii]|uniref:Putative ABC transporter permease protein n=1 Tax=Acidipropionibacterium virtanenii TaxID=2057246 RepID=A0A344UPP6_9ACTN|nr:iron ABC transporter permease [Acidipropionibacterium virtanenii]AXE37244.1 putative ABC transporter permease protein [Acidipropionibacterium virtanenii]